MKTKTIAMIMAMVMIVVCMVSGTLAWLTDTSGNVTNTFTTAGIEIELYESKKPDGTEVTVTNGVGVTDWSAAMIPGYTYSKNPKVVVKANSVDCYLFVKFVVTNPSQYVTFESKLDISSEGWTKGTGASGDGVPENVWYRKVTSSTSDQSWELLKDNQVKISGDLKKEDMPENGKTPTMTYTAYASQLWKSSGVEFTAAEAWTNANPAT